MNNIDNKIQNFQIIGHRGAAAYAPENTLASFTKAKELGCNYIEFDVVESIESELFIFHDRFLERTTNGRGAIDKVDANYLKSLDAGKWFSEQFANTKIPTLREAISWLVENDMRANLEIKPFNDNILSITTGVLKNLDLFWPQDMSLPIISSFNYEVLQLLKEYKPNLPLGLLLEFWPPDWLDLAQKINCKNINISKQIITKNIVSEIKLHGFTVNVFTVNTPKLAYTLCDWGVAGIFSDYPDLLSSGFGNKHK